MVQLTKEEDFLQKKQEALNFVGKNGPEYVQNLATKEEKEHFEGTVYHGGVPLLPLLSYIASPNSLY